MRPKQQNTPKTAKMTKNGVKSKDEYPVKHQKHPKMTHKTAQNNQIRKDLSVSAFQGVKNLKSPFKKESGTQNSLICPLQNSKPQKK
jgi:hypothetical protein